MQGDVHEESISDKESETSVQEPEPLSNVYYDPIYLQLLSIDDGFEIVDYAYIKGIEFDFAVYELNVLDEDGVVCWQDLEPLVYWEIVVLKDGNLLEVIRQSQDGFAMFPPKGATGLVSEIDIDGDGNNDVLISLGSFGTQGARRYSLYLQRNDGLIHAPSFSDIPNPILDAENQVILSTWRNNAASHGRAVFRLIDDEYLITERLTTEDTSSPERGNWIDEELVDGQWHIRESLTTKEYGINPNNTYWTGDRWENYIF